MRWLLLLSLCTALVASAQDARALFSEGSALFARGKFDDAALKFEASWAARPLPVTKFNLARCYEAAGAPLRAIDAAQTYLQLSPDAADRRAVEALVLRLGRKLTQRGVQALSVTSTPSGARVRVDDEARGVTPLTVELGAGRHVLVLEQEGRARTERVVTFTLERPMVEHVELVAEQSALIAPAVVVVPAAPLPVAATPAPLIAKAEARQASVAPWLITGGALTLVGAVGLTWSAVTWGQLQHQRVDLPAPMTFVPREELERLQWVYPGAWIAAGVGLAALGVGVALGVHHAVTVTPGAGTLTVSGRF